VDPRRTIHRDVSVVKAPSAHHREGDLYEVHIRLALPEGQEVNVECTPPEDERRSDLAFAISDGFQACAPAA
jgi:hypothetical protein